MEAALASHRIATLNHMNLIITVADASYFSHLQLFVASLRERGAYDGGLVIVEHGIPREGRVHYEHPFTPEHLEWLESHGATVLRYGDLIEEAGLLVAQVESITTRTRIFPAKQIATTLVCRRFASSFRRVCYFDADTYVQSRVTGLFDILPEEGVAFAPETRPIVEREWARSTLSVTDLASFVPQGAVERRVHPEVQICAGFFGGSLDAVGRFGLLWLSVGSSRLFQVHSDQPLLNLLV